MGLVRSVAKNTLAMGSAQFASQISTFILSIFLQYYLSNEYGVYSYAFSLASLIFILSDFGLGFQMVVKVAPRLEIAPRYLTNTILLRGILGSIGMLITLAVVLVSGLPAYVSWAIMIIALATAFNWISMTFTSMMTAFEKMHYVLYTSLVERCFTVAVAIGMLMLGYGLGTVVMVVLTGSVLYMALSFVVTSRYVVKPARRPSLKEAREQLRTGVPFALTGVMQTSMYSLNAVLIWNLIMWFNGSTELAAHDTAVYNLGFNLVVALIAVPTILISALMPVISRLYQTSTDLTRLTQQKVMKYMFTLGLPITVGGILLAEKIITLLYAPEFWDSSAVFRLLVPAIAINYFGTGIGSVLASADRIRLNTMASTTGAIVNAVLCLALIPFLGATGGAIAFSLACLGMTGSALYFMSKHVFKVDLADILARPILAAAGMGAVLILLPGLSLIPSLLIGAGAYFVLLYIVGALDKEDKEILVKILKKGA